MVAASMSASYPYPLHRANIREFGLGQICLALAISFKIAPRTGMLIDGAMFYGVKRCSEG
jgi:hypothetical protein